MFSPINPRIALNESLAVEFVRAYLAGEGFIEMFPPSVVRASGACENIDTLFEVSSDGESGWFLPYDGGGKRAAYLAQTRQLYLEAYVPYLQKTYCMGPSFRAEAQVDDRHLTEFGLLEIEFAGGFEKLLEYIEKTVKAIVMGFAKLDKKMLERTGLARRIDKLLLECTGAFPTITYEEAIECLAKMGKDICRGDDISSANEKLLVKEFGDRPLLITHYPDPLWPRENKIEVEKFFNMLPDRKGNVLSADLILPYGGEAVGSAARVHEADELVNRLTRSKMFAHLKKRGGSLDDFSWYIEKVQQKNVAHAGCGFGMARIMQWLLAETKINRAVTFASNRANII